MTLVIAALAASMLGATGDGWSHVRQLGRGDEVTVSAATPPQGVTTLPGASFVCADDTALWIRVRGAVKRIARPDVRIITVRLVKTRGSAPEVARGFLLGALLGVVAAAGGGTGPNFCTDHPRGCVPVGVAVGGGLLGAASYFGGKSEKIVEERIVYRAPPVY
ncbi:MAG TPA: hypothetical protein VEU08_24735 [Vicinamibacterales bacterium]|nr:hypothetical protein [Vicinamibacterales bacterium]